MSGLRFTGELFEWDGENAWHFVRVPADLANDVRGLAGPPRGFGSVRVRATVGTTTWDTSVFPDRASGSYLLPVKKQVRTTESVRAGDQITVELAIEPDGEGQP